MILQQNEFEKLFSDYKLNISENQYQQFSTYSELLVEWNEKINLTAITDAKGISEKHFLDSVLPLVYTNIPENASVADIGTGAGFPGIPLKIMREDISLTLIDSLNKRINFLDEVVKNLGLENVSTIHTRAEEGSQKAELREAFDIATARAVAALPVLCEYCLPYVKIGGFFMAMKGPEEDISVAENAIKILGGKLENAVKYDFCGNTRNLYIIRKISATPKKYPRNSGQIKKKAL